MGHSIHQSGFTGLGRIENVSDPSDVTLFRFLNADISLNQGINTYLPSYGDNETDKGLVRIVSISTGDVTGRVSLLLTENKAQYWYDYAFLAKEFFLRLTYYGGAAKTFRGVMESLSFDCKAGEMIQVSFDFVSKTYYHTDNTPSNTMLYTVTEKLCNWSKAFMKLDGYVMTDLISLSYNIKNNLVPIKTASGLLPTYINRGVQDVSGDIVKTGSLDHYYGYSTNEISKKDMYLSIDNLTIEHKIANHWTYRAPLSPQLVTTTLNWTKVTNLS